MKMMTKTNTPKAASMDDWVDMWEKAQADGVFANAPRPKAHNPGSYFGMQYAGADADLPPAEADTEYWNQVYQRSSNAGDAPDVAEPIITEQKKPVEKLRKKKKRRINEDAKSDVGDIAKVQGRTPNPIYHYNVGKDQEPHVTPNWSSGPELNQLIELKVKLHALEGKVNTMLGQGKSDRQVQKLEAELRKLRTRLDELSDSLHGGWAGEVKD
jgi:hypothetical protein